jgi:hypothetical protein
VLSLRDCIRQASWALLIWPAMIAVSMNAYALAPASPLKEQVATVLGHDLGVSPAALENNLRVLAPFASLPLEAALHVVSIRRDFAPGMWIVRLDCTSRHDCLPFVALLRSEAKPPAMGSWPMVKATPGVASVVHGGDHVEVVAEGPGIKLRATGVCLDSGGLGQRIRVRNSSTHRVLVATVAGQKLVTVTP